MKPPEDRPDTLILLVSMFSAGSGAAWAAAASSRPPRAITIFRVIVMSPVSFVQANGVRPRVVRGSIR
jgi:hypothetical protein